MRRVPTSEVPSVVLVNDSDDRRKALGFIRRRARLLYNCAPPPPSRILFLGKWNGKICGTIALDFAENGEKLPLESIYDINHNKTPWPFNAGEVAQFGKWWATQPNVSVLLMHAAHVHAIKNGKKFGISEAKTKIASRVSELGMVLREITSARLKIDNVPIGGRGYYLADPPPRPYMFDLVENAASLKKFIDSRL